MCMYDSCDDTVEVLSSSWHTARITHKCNECRRSISPGERYFSDRYVFDGQFCNHKVCAHCMVVREWLQDECGGFVYGGVEEDIREHAYSSYPMDVKRLAVGMWWDWTTPSGRLMPVPKRPPTSLERAAAEKAAA